MLVAISGGIGAGKSVVSTMLVTLGYKVYDCDSRARQLIDNDTSIKGAIAAELGENCILPDGTLNRKAVSDIVFHDADKLAKLNAISHGAVRNDLAMWQKEYSGELLFVETAILYQSRIDEMVDAVIEVTAPTEIRVERIRRRNGLEYNEIIRRIESQNFEVDKPHARLYTIVNDGVTAVLPQLQSILTSIGGTFKSEIVGIRTEW